MRKRLHDFDTGYTLTWTRVVLWALIAFWLIVFNVVRADVNLAVICTGAPNGAACQPVVYNKPQAASLVHVPGAWKTYGTLAATDTLEVATNDIAPGSLSDPASGAPATAWAYLAKSLVPASVPVSTSGTIALSWSPVTLCHDVVTNVDVTCNATGDPKDAIVSYKVYSGASATALGLMQTVNAATLNITLPGYNDGTYYFAVSALNNDPANPEGAKSTVASIIVKKPVAAHGTTPITVTGTKLTVTF